MQYSMNVQSVDIFYGYFRAFKQGEIRTKLSEREKICVILYYIAQGFNMCHIVQDFSAKTSSSLVRKS